MTEAARKIPFPRPVPDASVVSTASVEKLSLDQKGEHHRRNLLDELQADIIAAEIELQEDNRRLDQLVEQIEMFVSRRESLRDETRKVERFMASLGIRR